MPAPVAAVLGVLLVVLGLALVGVALPAARSRLPRNRWVGVRTPATLRSDAAFAVGNRVAAPLVAVAGVVAVAAGALALATTTGAAPRALAWVAVVVGLVWPLVLTLAGGLLGDRAARVATPEPQQSVCGGACAGCSLVAGCGSAAAGQAGS